MEGTQSGAFNGLGRQPFMLTARKFLEAGRGDSTSRPRSAFLRGARSSTARRRTLSAVRDPAKKNKRETKNVRSRMRRPGSMTKKRALSPCEDAK